MFARELLVLLSPAITLRLPHFLKHPGTLSSWIRIQVASNHSLNSQLYPNVNLSLFGQLAP
jgi:hypothetical protein